MTVTQRIFEIAKEQRISLTQLSKDTGIPIPTLSSWKQRNTCPPSDKLTAIADALNVPVSKLLEHTQGGNDNSVTIVSEAISNTSSSVQVGGMSQTIMNVQIPKEGSDFFNNAAVTKAYEGLTEREKLSVQMFILDTAAASEKSNATVT